MMKTKLVSKYYLLTTILGLSLLSNAQQEKHNNVVYIGLGSYMISQNKADPINEFSPTVDIVYNRFLDDGFVVGAGYCFKNIIHPEYNIFFELGYDKIRRSEENHTLMLYLGYNIKIFSFRINPYIAAGVGVSRYKPKNNDVNKKIDTYFDINPGVKFEYIISRWMIFTSYSFDFTPQYDHLYHNINVGLGYLF